MTFLVAGGSWCKKNVVLYTVPLKNMLPFLQFSLFGSFSRSIILRHRYMLGGFMRGLNYETSVSSIIMEYFAKPIL
jgi:hypothetical protein